jgi:hypothetical protein
VYDSVEWVAYMTELTKGRRALEYKNWNFGGTTDWAVDLQKEGTGGGDDDDDDDDDDNGDPEKDGDGLIYIDPEMWDVDKGEDAKVKCYDPCTYVLPPISLSSPTTISFPPCTTSVEVGWFETTSYFEYEDDTTYISETFYKKVTHTTVISPSAVTSPRFPCATLSSAMVRLRPRSVLRPALMCLRLSLRIGPSHQILRMLVFRLGLVQFILLHGPGQRMRRIITTTMTTMTMLTLSVLPLFIPEALAVQSVDQAVAHDAEPSANPHACSTALGLVGMLQVSIQSLLVSRYPVQHVLTQSQAGKILSIPTLRLHQNQPPTLMTRMTRMMSARLPPTMPVARSATRLQRPAPQLVARSKVAFPPLNSLPR